ncbi:heme-copper oxidase subunit III [Haloferula chungangensis]|uniref:Heme-copper oxidase subunit III n=1 Tax=Haloferula chungangensis TaxID=1048331 RepID=A0ABW2L407_9BACT
MEIPYIVTPRKDTGLFNSKIAIWLFLASEVMLFGGFFSAYVFLRIGADYPWPERTLPVLPGLINTFILIFSSVTVVFAWASLKMRNWRRFQIFMGITVACAAVFMVLKGLEYNVKFHHQAARLTDYSVLEGHLGYEVEGGHGHGHDEEPKFVKDADGNKIEDNHYKIAASSVTFDVLRAYKPWVETLVGDAARAGTKVTLSADIDLNAEGESDESKIFKAGTELSYDLISKISKAHIANRNDNAAWRTKFLSEAWDLKWAEVKANDELGEGAFAADFPKGLELGPDERRLAYARWKAGKRASMATSVDLNNVTLKVDGKKAHYADLVLPEQGTATFEIDEPFTVRFTSHDVISKYDPNATSVTVRDGTVIGGKYEDSSIAFHYVDGIDFQHTAMKAEEKGQDPLIAIENTWLIKENPVVADLWVKHQKVVGQLEELLAKDGREPTHKDRYRMGWQEIAYYMETELADVTIIESERAPRKVTMTLKEHFKGPDYDVRKFPDIHVPREQVMLDSKFKPKWNTYYAIYFTITGLHGLHVIGGAVVLGYYLFCGRKMYLSNPEWLANRVEVGGLFWHFVDLVWIFAFPIFYLM